MERAYKVFLNNKYLGIETAPIAWTKTEVLECIRHEEQLGEEDILDIEFINEKEGK